MVTLTDKAVKAVRRFIKGSGTPEAGLRLAITGGGCSGYQYAMSVQAMPSEGDTVIACGNGLQLFIDGASMPLLQGATIDFVDNLIESGFTFHNPNAAASCGCGKSFSA
jgi:iron-sulfur cluster assembly accessory protein